MKLIVGLGNPGKEYEGTRHNVGFEVVDALAEEFKADWKKDAKRQAQVAKIVLNNKQLILAKPTTFMNESGRTVQALMSFFKLSPSDLLLVHDELDLEAGKIKLVSKGGAAGHKGVKDIQAKLGTKDIARLRIGIGKPADKKRMESWVLGKPRGEEKKKLLRCQARARHLIHRLTD